MATILAGRFDHAAEADAAVQQLLSRHYRREDISKFAINPPGQHGRTSVGGDEHADPEARGAQKTALTGAAVGAGVGTAAGSVAGPIGAIAGAAVGAYVGSLAGALSGAGEQETHDETRRRPAGVMVAVKLDGALPEDEIIRILRDSGAAEIERAEGMWRDGEWIDFDPVSEPHWIWCRETDVSRQPSNTPA